MCNGGKNGFILVKAWKRYQDIYSDHLHAEARTYEDGGTRAWVSLETN